MFEIKPIDLVAQYAAIERQNQLTKPQGSLGQLEQIATQLAGHQGNVCPKITAPWISVFAADHGITAEGVSAFPSVVTQEMVKNFSAGGAAITVLAKANQASFEVVDVGVLTDITEGGTIHFANLESFRVAAGSFNFLEQAAMSSEMLNKAMAAGVLAVERAIEADADLFIAGEMGIGNTTSATAIIAQLCNASVDEIVGMGTGIDQTQQLHKAAVIKKALLKHQIEMCDPFEVLRCVGGLEIAALAGAYLACAEKGLSMVIDGVIACSAALVVCEMAPEVKDWMIFGHQSVEPAQQVVFERLQVNPLLDLSLRLGEGSGAAMAIPVIKMACLLHEQMATFGEASVSESNDAH
ncbi:MAG: nicotinate-nucleotide--dimethylbenzimidazole phosphoribosyltransferase [Thiomicrorhabdus sp.]|nr:MAG: nicotinate-nucleotide--dimethylbenzimidazole phosphoribosyltransferase [Thiomicrorhabdus sp.]